MNTILEQPQTNSNEGAAPTETPAESTNTAVSVGEIPPAPVEKEDAQSQQTQQAPVENPLQPIEYKLQLPEGSQLQSNDVERITLLAKKYGLSNDEAQDLLAQESERVSSLERSFTEKTMENQRRISAQWVEDLKVDTEFGGDQFHQNVVHAKKVFEKFGNEELRRNLNESGFGNYPPLIKMMAKIGKSMGDDQLVTATGQTPNVEKKRDVANIFYGDTTD